jgi:ATP-dependent Clp protease adaptor protein ClpS
MILKNQPTPEVETPQKQETDEAPLYRVIIHNDDVTPMDFVLHILFTVFAIPNPAAAHIMYTAHLHGSAYVQTLPKPEARKRINQAHFIASIRGYPLKFTMEPE